MTKFKIKVLLTAAVLVFGATTASFAQQTPPGSRSGAGTGPGERSGSPSEAKRESVRKKIETVRIWKLTEALKLDTATSAKLASFLNSIDKQRMEIIRDNMTTMQELRRSLKTPKPDEKSLTASLDRLGKNRRALLELRDKELSGLKDILTTEQQARYVIFQQDFHREMREMIAAAREKEGAGRGRKGNGFGEPPASK